MADVEQAAESIWSLARQGQYYPPQWQGKLTLDEAYAVQFVRLAREVRNGDRQAGWKIGLTAHAIRQKMGHPSRLFGFVLASGAHHSGAQFNAAKLTAPAIEAELCFTLARDVRGPGVTPQSMVEAIDTVCPAFELVEFRGNMAADIPMGVADNVSQRAVVLGDPIRPFPRNLDLARVRMELRRNGEIVAEGIAGDVMDSQLESLAWLANALAAHGKGIEAGHLVMSGSFNFPPSVKSGERWEASFSGLGKVACSFT